VKVGVVGAEQGQQRVPGDAASPVLDFRDELGPHPRPLARLDLRQRRRLAQLAQRSAELVIVGLMVGFRSRHYSDYH
jgi:hypothetical protein